MRKPARRHANGARAGTTTAAHRDARAHCSQCLDQEAAVGRKQRHTRRTRDRDGGTRDGPDGPAGIKTDETLFVPAAWGGGAAGGRGRRLRRRLERQYRRGIVRGRRRAFGHVATAATAAAGGRLVRGQVGGLHPREQGGEDREDEPDEAFHAEGTDSHPRRGGNAIFPSSQTVHKKWQRMRKAGGTAGNRRAHMLLWERACSRIQRSREQARSHAARTECGLHRKRANRGHAILMLPPRGAGCCRRGGPGPGCRKR